MQYLEIVLKKLNLKSPTQLVLYYFDIANVEFIMKRIITRVEQDTSKVIKLKTSDIIDMMVERYELNVVRNQIHSLDRTISSLNSSVIEDAVKMAKSQINIEKYRSGMYEPKFCDYPRCSTDSYAN
jgi:hypothetical protein